MSKQKVTSLFGLIIAVVAFSSCAAPTYLPGPTMRYPTIENTCSFGVQNMDEDAKVEVTALTCHYEGFDVAYKILQNLVVSFTVINNTNKSLIIDKSKSYVLYDGYSTQLFKDVRSSRSTTFNNVQDAINNVQTNEAGVSMTIPPYSKWEVPLQETNLREIKRLPAFNKTFGVHSVTPYDNQETVEFVLPFSYDYSLANWKTIRNRIYVNSIEVERGQTFKRYEDRSEWVSPNRYKIIRTSGEEPDYTEANRIDAINWKTYKKHKRAVAISHGVWGTVLLPCYGLGALLWLTGCNHQPPHYGNIPMQ